MDPKTLRKHLVRRPNFAFRAFTQCLDTRNARDIALEARCPSLLETDLPPSLCRFGAPGPDFDFVKAPVFQRRRNQSYDALSIRSFEGSSSSLDDLRSPTVGNDSDTGYSPHQTGSSSFHGESRNISENFLCEIKEEEDRASTVDAPPWAMIRCPAYLSGDLHVWRMVAWLSDNYLQTMHVITWSTLRL